MRTCYIIICLSILNTYNLFAQWQPDVRLTNNSSISRTSYNAWCIGTNKDSVHVVWTDNRDGNDEIYYKRSIDRGINWGVDTRLTNNPADSYLPSISVSGPLVHIVWEDNRDGTNEEIYYKRSTDGGTSWGSDTRLTNNPSISHSPSISVSNMFIHVVWADKRDGNFEIYYKRSSNSGFNWGTDVRLTSNSANSLYPSISVSGSNVQIVWYDDRDGNNEIYSKRSTDGGINWGIDVRLTNNSGGSFFPSVAVYGSKVHVVWHDNRDGNDEIYYKRSTDGGINWDNDTRLTNNSAYSSYPSIASSGSAVHIVWEDERDGNFEIYYKRSTDEGTTWELDTRLTNNNGYSEFPSLSISGSVVHVVWFDNRDGNDEIYYKRNPSGNPIGITNNNSYITKIFSLIQNYPNPFNPSTTIEFDIPKKTIAKLIIYDVVGREIEILLNEELKAGSYKVNFDGSNLGSGIYFYRLITNEYNETRKMILLR